MIFKTFSRKIKRFLSIDGRTTLHESNIIVHWAVIFIGVWYVLFFFCEQRNLMSGNTTRDNTTYNEVVGGFMLQWYKPVASCTQLLTDDPHSFSVRKGESFTETLIQRMNWMASVFVTCVFGRCAASAQLASWHTCALLNWSFI